MSERSERIGWLSVVPHDGGGERSEAAAVSERSERIGWLSVVPHDGGERSEAAA